MTNRTRPSSGLFGGALPPAGDGVTPAFLFAHPPCANFARDFADRINAHGYSVARNPNRRRRRPDVATWAHTRIELHEDIAKPGELIIRTAR